MINSKTLSAFAGAFLTLTSLSSQAGVIDGWGAKASAVTGYHCRNGCSADEHDMIDWTTSGGEFSSYATTEENTHGESKALVDLSGEDYLPILKVMASASLEGVATAATAFASQGFDYLGDESTSFTLNLNLHGSVGGNSMHTSISADIGVLIGSSMPFYADWNFDTTYYEAGIMGVGTSYLNISSGNDVNEQGTISFDLNPGDSFFVISEMSARATSGYADAWNTLTMNFTDSTGLQAVTAPKSTNPVPEPSSIILVLLALAFLFRQQQTKQN